METPYEKALELLKELEEAKRQVELAQMDAVKNLEQLRLETDKDRS